VPSAEIVAVGTELLLGQLVDTNTAFIAQALAGIGMDVHGTHTVGDNRERIAELVGGALERADGVITSGGLGPTVDDVTKEAVCDALGAGTRVDGEAIEAMEALFASAGRELRENNRKQAILPHGATVLKNAHGTAPGFVAWRADGKFVACVPGVPFEMKAMVAGQLLPLLERHFHLRETIVTHTLHTFGIAESEIDHRIADLFEQSDNPKIAVLAHRFTCDVKLNGKAQNREEAQALIAPMADEIRARLGAVIYGSDSETLAFVVLQLMRERGERLGVAESCTGGLVSAELTAVAGASDVFVGGVVAYDNDTKTRVLGVPPKRIAEFGAVSGEVASDMAQGARTNLGSDWAVSVTGVAGPSGGTSEKPVGLVYAAIVGPYGVTAHRLQLSGERAQVQQRATIHALGLLWRRLRAEPKGARET